MSPNPTQTVDRHCLLWIRRKERNDDGSNDKVALELSTKEEEPLLLLPGENWLQWNETEEHPMPSVFSLSAEVTDMVHLPPSHEEINGSVAASGSYPSGSSFSNSASSANEERFHCSRRTVQTERCYLCVDVDAAVATIKDMRDPLVPEAESVASSSRHWTVHLQRSPNASTPLSRRRLRVLKDADRILFHHPKTGAILMELEYRYGKVEKGEEEVVQNNKDPKLELSHASSSSTSVPNHKEMDHESIAGNALRNNEPRDIREYLREEALTTQSPLWESASPPPVHALGMHQPEDGAPRHPRFQIQTYNNDDGMLSTLSSQQNTEEDMPSQADSQIPMGASSEPVRAANELLLTQPDRAPLPDAAMEDDDDDESTIDPRNISTDTRKSLPSSRPTIKEVAVPQMEKNDPSIAPEKERSSICPPAALQPPATTTPVRRIEVTAAHMNTVSSSVCSPELLVDSPMVPPVKQSMSMSQPAVDTPRIHDAEPEPSDAITSHVPDMMDVETIVNPVDSAVANLLENPQFQTIEVAVDAENEVPVITDPAKELVPPGAEIAAARDVSDPAEKKPAPSAGGFTMDQDVSDPQTGPASTRSAVALDQEVSNHPEIPDRPLRSARKRKIAHVMSQESKSTDSNSTQKRKTSRRLSASSDQSRSNAEEKGENALASIRILTTGFDFDNKQKKMVQTIPGATLIEDIALAHTATHVVATDGKTDIRRTSKLMIAICRTPNIVTLDWVIQSAKAEQPLDCSKFLITKKKDSCLAMEQQYKFSMSTTIDNIVRRHSSTDSAALLFNGWSIHVCAKVAGNKAPPMNEFRYIIEASGAELMPSLSSIIKILDAKDPSSPKCLLITSDPPTATQLPQKSFQLALQHGAIHRTTTWFFLTIMKQEIPDDEDRETS